MLQYRIEKYQYRSILVNIVSISYRSENPDIAHHYVKPGARPQPAEGRLWACAWFTVIVSVKVCVCVYLSIYLSTYVCPYAPT